MRPFLTLADSNEALPDSSRHQPVPGEVSAFFILLTSIAMQTLRNLYHSIPLDRQNPTHPVPMLSDHWPNGYAYFCTLVLWVSTFKLLAAECYRHPDTLRPIPFNSPRRAESNGTLPDSGGHVPANVSALFSLLTCIAMRTLRNQYYSIPLAKRNPTHSVLKLPDRWLKGYSYFWT